MDTLTLSKLICSALGTVGLAFLSRASLSVPGSHGFYRFFAWVAILGLVLLRVDVWLRDPFSWHQIISWALLAISAILVIVDVRLLRGRGGLDARWDEVPLVPMKRPRCWSPQGPASISAIPCTACCSFWPGVSFSRRHRGLPAVAASLFLADTARLGRDPDLGPSVGASARCGATAGLAIPHSGSLAAPLLSAGCWRPTRKWQTKV